MKVTLKQIAERTGVSINTVSMVLRGMSGISAPTRERVDDKGCRCGTG